MSSRRRQQQSIAETSWLVEPRSAGLASRQCRTLISPLPRGAVVSVRIRRVVVVEDELLIAMLI